MARSRQRQPGNSKPQVEGNDKQVVPPIRHTESTFAHLRFSAAKQVSPSPPESHGSTSAARPVKFEANGIGSLTDEYSSGRDERVAQSEEVLSDVAPIHAAAIDDFSHSIAAGSSQATTSRRTTNARASCRRTLAMGEIESIVSSMQDSPVAGKLKQSSSNECIPVIANPGEQVLPLDLGPGPLHDVHAYVEVYSKNENRSSCVANELRQLGATIAQRFSSKITHIIFKDGLQSTIDKARMKKIPVVSVLWVESCKITKARADESQFRVGTGKEGEIIGRLRRQRSLQPKPLNMNEVLSADKIKAQQRRQARAAQLRDLANFGPDSPMTPVAETDPEFILYQQSRLLASASRKREEARERSSSRSSTSSGLRTPDSMKLRMRELKERIDKAAECSRGSSLDSSANSDDSIDLLGEQLKKRLYGPQGQFCGTPPPRFLHGPKHRRKSGPARLARHREPISPASTLAANELVGHTRQKLRLSSIPTEGDYRSDDSFVATSSPKRPSRSRVLVEDTPAKQDLSADAPDFNGSFLERVEESPPTAVGGSLFLSLATSRMAADASTPSKKIEMLLTSVPYALLQVPRLLLSANHPVAQLAKSQTEAQIIATQSKKSLDESFGFDEEAPEEDTGDEAMSEEVFSDGVAGATAVRQTSGGGAPISATQMAVQEEKLVPQKLNFGALASQAGLEAAKTRGQARRDSEAPKMSPRLPVSLKQRQSGRRTMSVAGGSSVGAASSIPAEMFKLPDAKVSKIQVLSKDLSAAASSQIAALCQPSSSSARQVKLKHKLLPLSQKTTLLHSPVNFSPQSPLVNKLQDRQQRREFIGKLFGEDSIPVFKAILPSAMSATSSTSSFSSTVSGSAMIEKAKPGGGANLGKGRKLRSSLFQLPPAANKTMVAANADDLLLQPRSSEEDFKQLSKPPPPMSAGKAKAEKKGADLRSRSLAGGGPEASTAPKPQAKKAKRASMARGARLGAIVMSSLHTNQREKVTSIVTDELNGFVLHASVIASTTHVVCGDARRTLNVLLGMSYGCWIVSLDWVLRSAETGKWLSETEFELSEFIPSVVHYRLSRFPSEGSESSSSSATFKLFASLGPIFLSSECSPPDTQLKKLIELNGGKTTTAPRRAALCIRQSSVTATAPCVTERWVLDSICERALQPFDEYKTGVVGTD